jgi:hypothetical protein
LPGSAYGLILFTVEEIIPKCMGGWRQSLPCGLGSQVHLCGREIEGLFKEFSHIANLIHLRLKYGIIRAESDLSNTSEVVYQILLTPEKFSGSIEEYGFHRVFRVPWRSVS